MHLISEKKLLCRYSDYYLMETVSVRVGGLKQAWIGKFVRRIEKKMFADLQKNPPIYVETAQMVPSWKIAKSAISITYMDTNMMAVSQLKIWSRIEKNFV